MWPPRRTPLVFDDYDYKQKEDTKQEPPRRRNKERRRVNPFIDAEAGVDGDASNAEESDNENDELDGFIVADNIDF